MAYLYVFSPHDGRQVKVREQDVGRSVRDGENRIFYVLQKSDGSGPYGSLTREGGPEQEAKYDAMRARETEVINQAKVANFEQVHDATGKKRKSGTMLVLVFLAIVAVAAWAVLFGPLKDVVWTPPPGDNAGDGKTQVDNPDAKAPDDAGGK